MKIINRIISLLVGGVFIFSGLIKLIDPVGTEIKLEEYFEVFANDQTELGLAALSGLWEFLAPFSLELAVLLSVLEVTLGLNLLLMYKPQTTLWTLLFTIIFFTFLTFYSAYFDKVTDCGCFGDAIKLTPWQSFTKDVILSVLIIWLFIFRKQFSNNTSYWAWGFSLVATLASFGLAYYAILHLPPLDFRPYHVGASLPKQMQPSEELQYGPEVYIYQDLEKGEEIRLDQQEFTENWKKYSDTTRYQYVEFKKPLLNPEAAPKITDFAVTDTQGNEVTEALFKGAQWLVIIPEVETAHVASLININQMARSLEGTQVRPVILTASDEKTFEAFRHQIQLSIPNYYFVDKKVLKTMIRANPGLILLQDGVVRQKWHYNDAPTAEEVIQWTAGEKEETS